MPLRERRCAAPAQAGPDRQSATTDAQDARGGAAQRGAITVEYVLVMALAAAILMGIEADVVRPMAKDILKNFMDFIVKPYP